MGKEMERKPTEGDVHIILKQYLERIKQEENAKPPHERRRVPSIAELARAIGIDPVNLSRLANNRVNDLRLTTASKIIRTMRDFGFPMQVDDLIEFVEKP